jgi:hypothetical protein
MSKGPGMQLSRRKARLIGSLSILGVVVLQSFNGVACYHQGPKDFVFAFLVFVAPAVLIATIAVFTANPLRAVFASAFFAPWLVTAYYTDCVAVYHGGGASMVYVIVLLWGVPSALLGALIAGPIPRRFGVSVAEESQDSNGRS